MSKSGSKIREQVAHFLVDIHIPYTKYFKFIWRIILTNTIIGAVCVGIAAAINLGPF